MCRKQYPSLQEKKSAQLCTFQDMDPMFGAWNSLQEGHLETWPSTACRADLGQNNRGYDDGVSTHPTAGFSLYTEWGMKWLTCGSSNKGGPLLFQTPTRFCSMHFWGEASNTSHTPEVLSKDRQRLMCESPGLRYQRSWISVWAPSVKWR